MASLRISFVQRSLDGEVSSYIMLHPVSPWFIVTMLSVNGCGFQKPKPLNLPPKPLVTTPHSRSFRLGSERERCNILEGDRGSIDFGSGEKKLAFFWSKGGRFLLVFSWETSQPNFWTGTGLLTPTANAENGWQFSRVFWMYGSLCTGYANASSCIPGMERVPMREFF